MKFKMINIMLAAVLVVLASCAGETDRTDAVPAETAAQTEAVTAASYIEDNLPEMDFGGRTFRWLFQVQEAREFYLEESDGDVLNDVIYRSTLTVKERFNVTFSAENVKDYSTYAKKAIRAGDDAYDCITGHGGVMPDYAYEGMALNWFTEMDYNDFDKPWWARDSVESLSVAGKLYMPAGDITYGCVGSSTAVLFNKNLFRDLNIEYPYGDVAAGTWTLDKVNGICRLGMADLNGDSAMDPENDRYGYLVSKWATPVSIIYIGGGRMIAKDSGGLPYFCFYNELNVKIIDEFFEMVVNYGHVGEPLAYYDAFIENRSLFAPTEIQSVSYFREMESDFGILPQFKYSESVDKYYCNVAGSVALLIIPVTAAENTDFISIVIEAMSAEGYRQVRPVYYETVLKVKFTRDTESEAMIDYITDGRVFDLGRFDNRFAAIKDLTYNLALKLDTDPKPDIASAYAKLEPAALKALEKYIEVYGNME